MNSFKYIGQEYQRFDAEPKVKGSAVYGSDFTLPGMLIGRVLRSTYAHARIVNIDISQAKTVPGVVAVLTGSDMPIRVGRVIYDQPFLALDKVVYHGEPVVAVAAETVEAAEEALSKVKVEYEPLEPVLDVEKAMEVGTGLVHPDLKSYKINPPGICVEGTNICTHRVVRHGNTAKAFSEADFVVEGRYTTPIAQHCCIEPECCTAVIESDGKITLYDSTQSVYRIRKALATVFGKKESDIRIVLPYLGGGFGEKNSFNQEMVAIALAMHSNGRPVKVLLDRSEEFTAGVSKHSSVIYIRSAIKDGKITGREVKVIFDTGAFAHTGPTVAGQSGLTSAGPYNIENIDLDVYAVYTNKIPAGSFRGYGVQQLCWAYEMHTSEIAQRLGMDAMDLRYRTLLRNGDENVCGEIMKETALVECFRQAQQELGSLEPQRIGNKLICRGIAGAWKLTGAPSSHMALIKMESDASVTIFNSTSEMGQGCLALWQAIVCEELGLEPCDVNAALPDSVVSPYTEGTTSSRAGALDGYSVMDACRKLKKQLLELASPMLGVSVEHLVVKDKSVVVPRSGKSVSFVDILTKSAIGNIGELFALGECRTNSVIRVDGQKGQSPYPTSLWLQVAQAVELEIDLETGEIQVRRVVSAHDIGKVLSLSNCIQQVHGGVLMGIGAALYEDLKLDSKGRVLNSSFLDYKIPTPCQVPEIKCLFVEDQPSACGLYGSKGLGEGANIAIPSAIADAIYRGTGIRFTELPITAEKMYFALKEKNNG